jgi:hypothetical protein
MLTVSVILRRSGQPGNHAPVFARLFSEWFNCSCSSPVFGDEDALPWQQVNEETTEAMFVSSVGYDVSTPEKLQLFNEKPGVYVVLINDVNPVGFSYVDCSSFIMECGTCYAKHTHIGNYEVDFLVTVTAAFLPLSEAIKLEPVVLNVKR